MSYGYFDLLSAEAKKHYSEKLKAIKLSECPYRLPADAWKDDTSLWPNVEYPDIYDYLINTPGVYTKEKTKSRKGLDAYNQFQSGWVGKVYIYTRSQCNIAILKAAVMHSQRLSEEALHPWIAAKQNCDIICAHCNCMAGLGESCSHIGAILFKVEAAVCLGYTRVACTDKPCQWNNDFVKKIDGTELTNIEFYKKSKIKAPAKRTFSEATSTEQNILLQSLKEMPATDQPVAFFRVF